MKQPINNNKYRTRIMKDMRVFSVAGFSGTGKTKLISTLIRDMQSKGYTVGVVKSTSKDVQQPDGTDTGTFHDAGSEFSVLLGPTTTTVSYSRRVDIREILRGVETDFVFVEGAKKSNIPKIWCVGTCDTETRDLPENVKAIVYWKEYERECRDAFESLDIPIYTSVDIASIAEVIINEAVALNDVEL